MDLGLQLSDKDDLTLQSLDWRSGAEPLQCPNALYMLESVPLAVQSTSTALLSSTGKSKQSGAEQVNKWALIK